MNNSGKYILIVDDNLKNLQLTASILKDDGFLISLAQDAEAALLQLNQLIPDLILLDVMMPVMDGYELCRLIKENNKLSGIPVIFLTAKNQPEDLAEGFRAGGVDFISKPFNREELLIRVKTHIELALSRKKILEMNKTRDKLYSIIAHDIRSPFSSIAFTISAIANGFLEPGTDEFKEIMTHLEKSTFETSILLDNLLEWTNLHSDSLSMAPRLINIYPVILECVQLLKGNADNKNITINVDVCDDFKAFADEITMHTVIRNLIFNAIKFTPENGVIEINAVLCDGFTKISIKDSGIGIPEEVIENVFRKNGHYTSPGTNNEKGSGLGSIIVKDFIEKTKGKIEVLSTPGSGTEVLVYLPLTDS